MEKTLYQLTTELKKGIKSDISYSRLKKQIDKGDASEVRGSRG